MRLFEKYLKPLMEIGIESIAKETGIDEYSKKLNLREHLKLLIYSIIYDRVTLTALCDSLQSKDAEKNGLISISKAQLSVVNENRDYRVFVWIFYELLYSIIHKYHALSKIYDELDLMGIDATSIKLNLPFSSYGHYSLTNTIEKGIKIHFAALLGRFTIPLTAMVTPMNVNDSNEFDDLLTGTEMFVDPQKVTLVFDRGYWSLKRGVKYKILTKNKEKRWEEENTEIEFTSLLGFKVRLVFVHDGDKDLFYATNIWDISPEEIHHCYKQRWDMEILNKDLKSNLKIDHFIGKNLNAVLIQIFTTLIAYLLIALFRIFYNPFLSIREIKRILKYYGRQSLQEARRVHPILCSCE